MGSILALKEKAFYNYRIHHLYRKFEFKQPERDVYKLTI